jgi:ribosomal protein S18 acetylase RimI-like enzyme
MPDIQIRSAVASDLSAILAIDHSCQTEYVWQMDVQHEGALMGAFFREIRLPRSVTVLYPRPLASISELTVHRSKILVAYMGELLAGYIFTDEGINPGTAWVKDLVISPRYRRQGIGTMLVTAVQTWAVQHKNKRVFLETTSKNNPAIQFALKLGYEFCGYNDQYYLTHDIALFFGRFIR